MLWVVDTKAVPSRCIWYRKPREWKRSPSKHMHTFQREEIQRLSPVGSQHFKVGKTRRKEQRRQRRTHQNNSNMCGTLEARRQKHFRKCCKNFINFSLISLSFISEEQFTENTHTHTKSSASIPKYAFRSIFSPCTFPVYFYKVWHYFHKTSHLVVPTSHVECSHIACTFNLCDLNWRQQRPLPGLGRFYLLLH